MVSLVLPIVVILRIGYIVSAYLVDKCHTLRCSFSLFGVGFAYSSCARYILWFFRFLCVRAWAYYSVSWWPLSAVFAEYILIRESAIVHRRVISIRCVRCLLGCVGVLHPRRWLPLVVRAILRLRSRWLQRGFIDYRRYSLIYPSLG
jgi:hypothetical protein